jgi:FeS assembly SUF system protein
MTDTDTQRDYEDLKTRRLLPVMNADGPEAPPDAFVLEGEGERPNEAPANPDRIRADIIDALKTVYDPEIPLNIYDLGLIYAIDVEDGNVHIKMTLTAPGCPVAGSLLAEVHERMLALPGIKRGKTELVWDPPWTQARLTDEAKLELGLL